MLLIVFLAMLVSFVGTTLLIRYAHLHRHVSGDAGGAGFQKFHVGTVPRIGGIPVLLGLLVGIAAAYFKGIVSWQVASGFLLACLPVFCAGLAEDMTKQVRPRWRLLASFLSAAVGALLLNAVLTRLAVPGLDHLIAVAPWLGFLLTVFVVGGMCHSLNIIDGYNGLSGGVAGMILLALGFISWKTGDQELLIICVISVAAIGGFVVWNFPRGLIFAGDGGAYLFGFLIAVVSVLLVQRHHQVSPWFPLMLVLYPVWETLFSIYRKKIIRGQSPGIPDGLHFHMLIYKRLVRWMVGSREAKHILQRNSMTAPYLWGMGALTIIPAVLFWQQTRFLQLAAFIFILFYLWLYRCLVRFRAPKWLVMRKTE